MQFNKILAMGAGNALEWYDFAVFGALADVIGENFFPFQAKEKNLMSSLCVFGSAFLMRPFGGVLLGYIGDTMGRKRALEISVALMLIPSILMGCLPPYEMWGLYSTILMILLRLLQGMAVGGELVGAFIFTIEATGGKDRGFWGAICKSSGIWGTALGMGFVAILRQLFSTSELIAWGWRIPFLSTVLVGGVGVYLRFYMEESLDFEKIKATQSLKSSPILAIFQKFWAEVFLIVLVVALWCVGYYTCFVWMAFYMTSLVGDDAVPDAWMLNFIMTVVLIFLLPVAGIAGDYMCRQTSHPDAGFRLVMIIGCALMGAFTIPAFLLINMRYWWTACLGQLLFAIGLACIGGNIPAFMTILFSTEVRYSGIGLAYNLANAIFAGTAPLIQTALVSYERSLGPISSLGPLYPSLYLVSISLLSFLSLLLLMPLVLARRKRLDEEDFKELLRTNRLGEDRPSTNKAASPYFWGADDNVSDVDYSRHSVVTVDMSSHSSTPLQSPPPRDRVVGSRKLAMPGEGRLTMKALTTDLNIINQTRTGSQEESETKPSSPTMLSMNPMKQSIVVNAALHTSPGKSGTIRPVASGAGVLSSTYKSAATSVQEQAVKKGSVGLSEPLKGPNNPAFVL